MNLVNTKVDIFENGKFLFVKEHAIIKWTYVYVTSNSFCLLTDGLNPII